MEAMLREGAMCQQCEETREVVDDKRITCFFCGLVKKYFENVQLRISNIPCSECSSTEEITKEKTVHCLYCLSKTTDEIIECRKCGTDKFKQYPDHNFLDSYICYLCRI